MHDTIFFLQHSKEIIKHIRYATVATTCDDGKPWNSPVSSQYDGDLNIYWVSDKEGQHSRNVRQNPNVFIVFYDSTIPEGQGEGVYIQAKAYELNDRDEILALRRAKKGPSVDDADKFLGDGVRRMYKAVPERVWMNDDETVNGVFIRDIRIELPLDELKKLLQEQ